MEVLVYLIGHLAVGVFEMPCDIDASLQLKFFLLLFYISLCATSCIFISVSWMICI